MQSVEMPLISVLVVCYNNFQYLTETLASIFEQTYPNIEVLIGDDASENFDAESLLEWIKYNRTGNIKKITVCENPVNLGTVANIEHLQEKSKGEYLLQIAGDDALHNPEVLEMAFNKMVELGEDCQMVIGQAEMWDIVLEKKFNDFVSEETADFVEKATAQEFFCETAMRILLPACCMYRRSMIEMIGKLSEHYRLVEDWPTQLRLARLGYKPYYYRDLVVQKHRDGGISHGNSAQSKKAFLMYYEDILRAYQYDIEPYRYLMNDESWAKVTKQYQDRLYAYHNIHIPNYEMAMQQAAAVKQNHSVSFVGRMKKLLRRIVKKTVHLLGTKRVVYSTACLFLLLLAGTVASAALQAVDSVSTCILAGLCVMAGGLTCLEVGCKIFMRMRKAMWDRYGS